MEANTGNKIPTKLRIIIGILIVAVIAAVSVSIYLATENSRIKSQEPKVPNAAGILLSGSDRNDALSVVSSGYNNIISGNGILNIQDSSGYTSTMIYNGNNEAVLEDPSTGARTIFLNNNHTVYIGDTIAYGQDSNVLMILEQAIKMAESNKEISVLKAINDLTLPDVDDEGNLVYTKYCIDIHGWDELTQLYSCVSDDFATAMIDNLKSQMIPEDDTNNTEDGDTSEEDNNTSVSDEDIPEMSFRLYYVMDDDNLVYGGCYVYFDEKPSDEITWNELQISWEIGEILGVDEWSLEDGWYSADWESLSDWEDTSIVEELFTNLYNDLTSMLEEKTNELEGESDIHDHTEDLMNESALSGNTETEESTNMQTESSVTENSEDTEVDNNVAEPQEAPAPTTEE